MARRTLVRRTLVRRTLVRRTLVLLVAALVAVLVATAAQSRPAATGTFDVGWVGDKSGPTVVSQAPVVHAMEAYFRMVNDGGGVKGRKINLIEKDDAFNPALELSAVKSFIDDGLPLITGLSTSSGIASVVPVLSQAKTVGFLGQATLKDVSSPLQKWVIEGNCNLADQADVGIAYEMARLKRKNLDGVKVGIASIAVASGQEWNDAAKERVSKLGGTTVIVSLPASIVNADVQVQELANAKVDFILFHSAVTGAVALLKSMSKYGFLVPVLSSYGATADLAFTNSPYEASKNFFGLHCYTPPPVARTAKARQAIAIGQKYGYPAAEIVQINWGLGWSQAMLITEALRRLKGAYTSANVLAAFESIRNFDTGGLSPKLSLAASCHMADRQVRPYTYNYKTKTMQPVGTYEQWAKYVTNAYAAPGTCGKKR
jgi:branched-chain amino acid transport system substrate-binding protein